MNSLGHRNARDPWPAGSSRDRARILSQHPMVPREMPHRRDTGLKQFPREIDHLARRIFPRKKKASGGAHAREKKNNRSRSPVSEGLDFKIL